MIESRITFRQVGWLLPGDPPTFEAMDEEEPVEGSQAVYVGSISTAPVGSTYR